MKRWMSTVATVGLVVSGLTLAGPAVAGGDRSGTQNLNRWAQDTWLSLDAMTDEETGLSTDNITGDLTTPSAYTSPTNIGGYLWSTVTARDLGLISAREAHVRMSMALDTLEGVERNDASGMFYNGRLPTTGEMLTTWPDSGDPVHPFLSTVDNGWLAAALRIVRDWDWQEQLPQGQYRTYSGVEVWEVALNHPITVAVQKQRGLDEAGYGYWGFSPASDPFGGYAEYGIDIAGMRSDGYTSDAE